jgi:branched-chain amino acid transport system ATP-binding protein
VAPHRRTLSTAQQGVVEIAGRCMSDAALLSVDKIEVVYKRVIRALRGVSLDLARGQIVAILGANGAGKTTTLRAISGFIGLDAAQVTAGSIIYKGEHLENRLPHQCVRLGVSIVPERDKIFPNLTVAENLTVAPSRIPAAERRRLEEMVFQFFPALAARRSSEAGLLSGGERQMLGIGAKLVTGPELLLVDELSLGLAPLIVQDLVRRLLQIKLELNLSILLVEQNAAVALQMADYAYVLENGQVAMRGDSASMRDNPYIREYYLGGGVEARRNYRDARAQRQVRQDHG